MHDEDAAVCDTPTVNIGKRAAIGKTTISADAEPHEPLGKMSNRRQSCSDALEVVHQVSGSSKVNAVQDKIPRPGENSGVHCQQEFKKGTTNERLCNAHGSSKNFYYGSEPGLSSLRNDCSSGAGTTNSSSDTQELHDIRIDSEVTKNYIYDSELRSLEKGIENNNTDPNGLFNVYGMRSVQSKPKTESGNKPQALKVKKRVKRRERNLRKCSSRSSWSEGENLEMDGRDPHRVDSSLRQNWGRVAPKISFKNASELLEPWEMKMAPAEMSARLTQPYVVLEDIGNHRLVKKYLKSVRKPKQEAKSEKKEPLESPRGVNREAKSVRRGTSQARPQKSISPSVSKSENSFSNQMFVKKPGASKNSSEEMSLVRLIQNYEQDTDNETMRSLITQNAQLFSECSVVLMAVDLPERVVLNRRTKQRISEWFRKTRVNPKKPLKRKNVESQSSPDASPHSEKGRTNCKLEVGHEHREKKSRTDSYMFETGEPFEDLPKTKSARAGCSSQQPHFNPKKESNCAKSIDAINLESFKSKHQQHANGSGPLSRCEQIACSPCGVGKQKEVSGLTVSESVKCNTSDSRKSKVRFSDQCVIEYFDKCASPSSVRVYSGANCWLSMNSVKTSSPSEYNAVCEQCLPRAVSNYEEVNKNPPLMTSVLQKKTETTSPGARPAQRTPVFNSRSKKQPHNTKRANASTAEQGLQKSFTSKKHNFVTDSDVYSISRKGCLIDSEQTSGKVSMNSAVVDVDSGSKRKEQCKTFGSDFGAPERLSALESVELSFVEEEVETGPEINVFNQSVNSAANETFPFDGEYSVADSGEYSGCDNPKFTVHTDEEHDLSLALQVEVRDSNDNDDRSSDDESRRCSYLHKSSYGVHESKRKASRSTAGSIDDRRIPKKKVQSLKCYSNETRSLTANSGGRRGQVSPRASAACSDLQCRPHQGRPEKLSPERMGKSFDDNDASSTRVVASPDGSECSSFGEEPLQAFTNVELDKEYVQESHNDVSRDVNSWQESFLARLRANLAEKSSLPPPEKSLEPEMEALEHLSEGFRLCIKAELEKQFQAFRSSISNSTNPFLKPEQLSTRPYDFFCPSKNCNRGFYIEYNLMHHLIVCPNYHSFCGMNQ